jgi:hypothetical protein
LAVALAADRYSVRQRRRLLLRFVVTDPAAVTIEVRRGRRRVAQARSNVGVGRAVMRLRAPTRGRYTLVLTASGGGQTATDQARLTVGR